MYSPKNFENKINFSVTLWCFNNGLKFVSFDKFICMFMCTTTNRTSVLEVGSILILNINCCDN